jgi:hypothetical protein
MKIEMLKEQTEKLVNEILEQGGSESDILGALSRAARSRLKVLTRARGKEYPIDACHNLASERRLLGGLILAPEEIPRIAPKIASSDFKDVRHKILMSCLKGLSEKGVEIDAITIGADLKAARQLEAAGGLEYISEILDSADLEPNFDHEIFLIKESL